MDILIVEDVPEMSSLMDLYLRKDGFVTEIAESGEKALLDINQKDYDLIILDLNLPGIDGFQCLKLIREEKNTPVLIVSARDDDDDIIKGLNIGADEYMSKPFSPKVLTARVNAILRRQISKNIVFGDFVFNKESYLLKKGDKRILISGKEFDILDFLIKNWGKPLTSEEIFENVWGDVIGDLTTVAVHIKRLRKKIEEDPSNPQIIKTIHGKGYCFGWDL